MLSWPGLPFDDNVHQSSLSYQTLMSFRVYLQLNNLKLAHLITILFHAHPTGHCMPVNSLVRQKLPSNRFEGILFTPI